MLGYIQGGKLKIPIGSQIYELNFVRGSLFAGRQRCASVCHHDRGTIDVSDTVPVGYRPYVTAAAVCAAWWRVTKAWKPVPLVEPVWEETEMLGAVPAAAPDPIGPGGCEDFPTR